VVEVVDKGRAALMVCEDTVGDYATGWSTWWIAQPGAAERLAGAATAGAPPPPAAAAAVPDAAPSFTASWTTTPEQAALHRLNGDRNPVHIDPALAATTGQPRPFLHGLCTFGALGLALDRAAGPDRHLTTLSGRFTRPVFPGDTLTFDAWDDLTVTRASVDGEPVLGPASAGWGGG
jgi:acyl dehydratase